FAEAPDMTAVRFSHFVLVAAVVAARAAAVAQGTAADYARAEGLRARVEGLVIDAADAPSWVDDGGSQLVYRKSVRGGYAFVLVDAATLAKRPAFDHDRLAAAFAAARDS